VPSNILIVDDEPAIADTLAYALRTEGFTVRCCGLGREALAALKTGDYALAILDVGLPDINGFDLCRELRRGSDVPVIFLTARSDEVDRIVGLELGADDYVAKPFSPREVASRVRAILRRARPSTPAESLVPVDTPRFVVDAEGARISYGGSWLSLTRYEYRLLAALLEKPGRVLSRARLMEMAWSDAEDSLERTVDAHVKTLRAKLRAVRNDDPADPAADPAADPIETHRGIGYGIRNGAA